MKDDFEDLNIGRSDCSSQFWLVAFVRALFCSLIFNIFSLKNT